MLEASIAALLRWILGVPTVPILWIARILWRLRLAELLGRVRCLGLSKLLRRLRLTGLAELLGYVRCLWRLRLGELRLARPSKLLRCLWLVGVAELLGCVGCLWRLRLGELRLARPSKLLGLGTAEGAGVGAGGIESVTVLPLAPPHREDDDAQQEQDACPDRIPCPGGKPIRIAAIAIV